jgi:hypothetical protein
MRSEERNSEGVQPHRPNGTDSSAPPPHSSLLTPHRIRLGPPWQAAATDSGTRHARKFGRPRTLDASEQLWLVCERVPGAAEVSVNGTPVGGVESAGAFAANITSLLRPRNEVVFAVASAEALGEVALEVRSR